MPISDRHIDENQGNISEGINRRTGKEYEYWAEFDEREPAESGYSFFRQASSASDPNSILLHETSDLDLLLSLDEFDMNGYGSQLRYDEVLETPTEGDCLSCASRDQDGLTSDESGQAKSSHENMSDDNLTMWLEKWSFSSRSFIILLIASVVVATLGLFENNTAIIIGAMIVAPLVRPLMGLAYGALTVNATLTKRSLFTVALGTVLGIVIAYALAVMLQMIDITSEIAARAHPTLLDLGVALFAGAAGAYCQTDENLSDTLAGVAIAVALVPPIAVIGIGLALGANQYMARSCLTLCNQPCRYRICGQSHLSSSWIRTVGQGQDLSFAPGTIPIGSSGPCYSSGIEHAGALAGASLEHENPLDTGNRDQDILGCTAR